MCHQAQTSGLSGCGKENGTSLLHAQHSMLVATGISPSWDSVKLPFEKLQEKEGLSQVGHLCCKKALARIPSSLWPGVPAVFAPQGWWAWVACHHGLEKLDAELPWEAAVMF